MSSLRIAIAGATGYTGEELIRLLLNHPNVELTYLAASAKWERPTPVSEVYPAFAHRLDLSIESLDLPRLISRCDIVFLALPHGMAMDVAPTLLKAGKRVIDLSGDFRLQDNSLYPLWYQRDHSHPDLLRAPSTVYGLTEFFRDRIKSAQLIANPGCYATSILLGILPLQMAGLVSEDYFIVDAKSGLSGAGRKPQEALLFSEMTENLRAYKVNTHQHEPEILQVIEQLTRTKQHFLFVPQVIPAKRGLIAMIYARVKAPAEAIRDAYRKHYSPQQTPFVRMRTNLPELKDVAQTNFCDIGFVYDARTQWVVVGSALDNLTKGAAGQALQNLNVMSGWPETTGLR